MKNNRLTQLEILYIELTKGNYVNRERALRLGIGFELCTRVNVLRKKHGADIISFRVHGERTNRYCLRKYAAQNGYTGACASKGGGADV